MTEETTSAIPAMQSTGRTRQEVGLLVQEELEIAGVTESTFVALRKEADALASLDPASDADAATLQKVITKGVRLCGTISSAIEPGKKWAYSLHKAYTSNENEFIGTVKAIIEPLKAKKAAYVARKEMLAQQALEAKERLIKERFVAIERFDFVRKTGTEGREDYYSNGTTILEIHQVSMAGEEEWNNIIRGVELAYNEEQDRKAEAERLAAEAANALRQRAEDLERAEKLLKEQQDRLNAQVNEARKNELLVVGFQDKGAEVSCFIPEPTHERTQCYIVENLHFFDDDGWQELLAEAKHCIGEKNKWEEHRARAQEQERLNQEAERIRIAQLQDLGALKEEFPALPLHQYDENQWEEEVRMVKVLVERREEDARKKSLIKERVEKLKAVGWELDGNMLRIHSESGDGIENETTVFTQEIAHLADMPEDVFVGRVEHGQAELARRRKAEEDRIAQEAVEKERQRAAAEAAAAEEARIENEKRAAKAEQRRIAQMGDVDKWTEFVAGVERIAPSMDSDIGKHALKRFIKGLKDFTPSLIQDLKK